MSAPSSIDTLSGGSIAKHLSAWTEITKDPWVLNKVRGVEIPFEEAPVQLKEPRPFRLSQGESEFVDQEIVRMIDAGIVEEAEPALGQVVSNIFLRPKKDGSYRMILDLTWLNTHVKYEHFKMTSL